MGDALWHLVRKCWSGNSIERPPCDQVAQTLNRLTLLTGPAYGRYRPPTCNIVQSMHDAFTSHPECATSAEGTLVAQLSAAYDIMKIFLRSLKFPVLGDQDLEQWLGSFNDPTNDDIALCEITPRRLLDPLTLIPGRTSSLWVGWRRWRKVYYSCRRCRSLKASFHYNRCIWVLTRLQLVCKYSLIDKTCKNCSIRGLECHL